MGVDQARENQWIKLVRSDIDQHIGPEETDDGIWAFHFNTVLLATFDERDCIIACS